MTRTHISEKKASKEKKHREKKALKEKKHQEKRALKEKIADKRRYNKHFWFYTDSYALDKYDDLTDSWVLKFNYLSDSGLFKKALIDKAVIDTYKLLFQKNQQTQINLQEIGDLIIFQLVIQMFWRSVNVVLIIII